MCALRVSALEQRHWKVLPQFGDLDLAFVDSLSGEDVVPDARGDRYRGAIPATSRPGDETWNNRHHVFASAKRHDVACERALRVNRRVTAASAEAVTATLPERHA